MGEGASAAERGDLCHVSFSLAGDDGVGEVMTSLVN